jgi:hypothetical protein
VERRHGLRDRHGRCIDASWPPIACAPAAVGMALEPVRAHALTYADLPTPGGEEGGTRAHRWPPGPGSRSPPPAPSPLVRDAPEGGEAVDAGERRDVEASCSSSPAAGSPTWSRLVVPPPRVTGLILGRRDNRRQRFDAHSAETLGVDVIVVLRCRRCARVSTGSAMGMGCAEACRGLGSSTISGAAGLAGTADGSAGSGAPCDSQRSVGGWRGGRPPACPRLAAASARFTAGP